MNSVSLPRSIKEAAEKCKAAQSTLSHRQLVVEGFEAGAQLVLERLVRAREHLEKLSKVIASGAMVELENAHTDACRKHGCYGHFGKISPNEVARNALAEIDAFLKGDKA